MALQLVEGRVTVDIIWSPRQKYHSHFRYS